MRSVYLCAVSLAFVWFAGCSFDPPPPLIDGSVSTIDAPPGTIDAPPGTIDAGIDAAPPDAAPPNISTELGRVCTTNSDCPADAPQCITLDQQQQWCTLSCGTSTTMSPPPGADDLCAAQYGGSSGTPRCALYDSCPNGTCTFYCAIQCGVIEGNDFGQCPNGLACTGGVCGGT